MPPPFLVTIALGDLTGIGPEVTLKALAAEPPADDIGYLLVGDEACIRRWNESLRLGLPLRRYTGTLAGGRVWIHQPAGPDLPASLQPGAPEAARAALIWLEEAAQFCRRGEVAALVTAPVNKEAIIRAGNTGFVGQTEYLAQLSGSSPPVMMLLGPDEHGRWLRVALATTHVRLKDVAARLTQDKVERAIELAAQACQDLGLTRARVGVCGLNPHAGEGGKLGDEEQTMLGPAVEAARRKQLAVTGPVAADTLFHQAWRGDFEAVVAMYHDQGLAPLKMVAFDRGVNWTLGLPFIRTSPDHGTAYGIAGRGEANPSSMIAALRLAKQLAKARRRAEGR
jgi:4-hydroxythreonine-4-phosphate dehydrogenase